MTVEQKDLTNTMPEEAFLGTVLNGHTIEHARQLLSLVQVDDFVDPRNKQIYEAAVEAVEANVMPDPIVVVDRMRLAGGHALFTPTEVRLYVLDLVRAGQWGSASYYAHALRHETARRRVQEAGVRLQQVAETSDFETLRSVVSDELASVFEAVVRTEEVAA